MMKKVRKCLEDAFYYLEVMKREIPESEKDVREGIEKIQNEVKDVLVHIEEFVEMNREKSLQRIKELLEVLE